MINIYKKSNLVLLSSLLLLFISGLSLKFIGFNKGIDFAGGIVVESTCDNYKMDDVARVIEKKIKSTIITQKIGKNCLFKSAITDNYEKIISIFKDVLEKQNAEILNSDFASPQMTKTFIDDSIVACLFAFVCIGLYVIIRFDWRFAISGILTLTYDVIMTLTFISYAKIEVCLITLTALLTIIGYCINDKIVVFDRIRENLYDTKPVVDVIGYSTKSVVVRSVLTSLTTIIASISLLFFGDRLIYEFGLTIIFGIVVGTISSLVVAPSLLLLFGVKHKKREIAKDPMWYAS